MQYEQENNERIIMEIVDIKLESTKYEKPDWKENDWHWQGLTDGKLADPVSTESDLV